MNVGIVVGNSLLWVGAMVSSHLLHASNTLTLVILPCLAVTSIAISASTGARRRDAKASDSV